VFSVVVKIGTMIQILNLSSLVALMFLSGLRVTVADLVTDQTTCCFVLAAAGRCLCSGFDYSARIIDHVSTAGLDRNACTVVH